MEAYPHDYVVHNLPLVLLSGLESTTVETSIGEKSQAYLGDGGFRIRADLPPVQHPLKDDLRATLLSYDRSDAPWQSHPSDKTEQPHAFKIRSVGRVGQTPAPLVGYELRLLGCRPTRSRLARPLLRLIHPV